MRVNPTGDDPAPDYSYGAMVVYVLGMPYLGTTWLTKEAATVAAEPVVADLDEDQADAA